MTAPPIAATRRKTSTRMQCFQTSPTLPAWMPRVAFAAPDAAPKGDTLVCVFQRGGMDGLIPLDHFDVPGARSLHGHALDDQHWETFGGDIMGRRALGFMTLSW